jgi:hypothetical protein
MQPLSLKKFSAVVLAGVACASPLASQPSTAHAAGRADDGEFTPSTPPKEVSSESPLTPGVAEEMLAAAGCSSFPWPIYFWECGTPWRIDLVNWTKCTLYFIVLVDCTGDGVPDTFGEVFVNPVDEATGTPWVETVEPKDGCKIVYFGLFDVIPWGKCNPGWAPDPFFPTATHFTE